jgi:hypothetical protein
VEKEEMKIEAPFTVARVTLVPVVEASLNCWRGKNSLSSFGVKQPFSLVAISPQGRQAFRMNGEEISLDQLTEEVPDIGEILKGI